MRGFGSILVILLASIFYITQPLVAKETSQPSSEIEVDNTATKRAKELLDSWRGGDKILNEARVFLDQALIENPDNYKALKELARYYFMGGVIDTNNKEVEGKILPAGKYQPNAIYASEAAITKAVNIKPDYAEGYVFLGYVYFHQSKIEQARAALARAESLGTDDPWLQLNWAELLYATGDKKSATDRYVNVIRSGTNNKKAMAAAYSYFIGYYKELRQFEKVNETYERLIEMDRENPLLYVHYADFVRLMFGDYDKAIKYSSEGLKILDFGEGRKVLANSLYGKSADISINHKGSEEDAQQYYDAAFRIYPYTDLVMAYEGAQPKGIDLVKYLMAKGVSIDATAEDGSTALIIASNRGRVAVVEALLSLGANPNAVAKNGWTALLGSSDEGYPEVVKILLEHGADLTQTIGGKNAMMLAQQKGNTALVQFLQQYEKNKK